jgi:NAD(P)-dependent dehydrogenase (short-subunit alcohol dehydrogenase family)
MNSTIADGSEGRLRGKAAIITGAARGIRRATAVAFARAGADVMGIDNGAL